jgi:hypothetical protein
MHELHNDYKSIEKKRYFRKSFKYQNENDYETFYTLFLPIL